MLSYPKKKLHNLSIAVLFVYAAVMMASMLHVHAPHAACGDHGVQIEAPACCGEHAHLDAECLLCEFIHSSNTVTVNANTFTLPVIEPSYTFSYQTLTLQHCLGGFSSRAPPVC